jgi:rare lipoprotein A
MLRPLCTALAGLLLLGCTPAAAAPGPRRATTVEAPGEDTPIAPRGGYEQRGLAAWYGGKFHGRRTASGERFDQHQLTAAHRTLPFGTLLRVERVSDGRFVIVRVNDRGPFSPKRIIDLSRGAAEALGMIQSGVAQVRLQVLSWGKHHRRGWKAESEGPPPPPPPPPAPAD